eukprot:13816728-Alexandrium_andersonii.AAC.1
MVSSDDFPERHASKEAGIAPSTHLDPGVAADAAGEANREDINLTPARSHRWCQGRRAQRSQGEARVLGC